MNILIIIGLIVITIVIIIQFYGSDRIPKNNTLLCFTGTLGSGKTYLAVRGAIKAYKRQSLKYKIAHIFRGKILKKWHYPPSLYSNINVVIKRKRGQAIKAIPLTREHVLLEDYLPENAIVLWDEIGQNCSQWDYDNPLVQEQVSVFIRFYRHFVNGKLFATDQVSDNIAKPIRSRFGIIYNLNNFRRFFLFLPFYKVDNIPLLTVEDTTTRLEDTFERYFFGILPYKWQKSCKHYESRTYRPLYRENAKRTCEVFDNDMYTRYLIDLSVSSAVRKAYQADKQAFKAYLYDKGNQCYKKLFEAKEVAKNDLVYITADND